VDDLSEELARLLWELRDRWDPQEWETKISRFKSKVYESCWVL